MKTLDTLQKREYINTLTGEKSNALIDVFDGNKISIESLKWYFELGYLPGELTLFENIKQVKKDIFKESDQLLINSSKYKDISYEDAIKIGKEKICQSISEKLNNNEIFLPLTSGLDSRIILGCLLENISAEKITTLTWGLPSGIDCKVGAMMSKKIGMRHHLMNLKDYKLTEKRLFDFAIASDFSVPLFDHWPVDWVESLVNEKSGELWLGLLGGTISGSNMAKSQAENPYVFFLNSNRRINSLSSVSASLLGTKPTIECLRDVTKYINNPNIDSLDIQLHHVDLISPTNIHRNFKYQFPFIDSSVMLFFLSLPFEYRLGRSVFKDIILNHFKHLSSFPSNRNGGLGLNVTGKKRSLYKKMESLNIKKSITKHKGSSKYLTLDEQIEVNEGLRGSSLFDFDNLSKIEALNHDNLKIINDEFFNKIKNKSNHSRTLDAILSLELIMKKL